MRRAYADGRYGQVHYREAGEANAGPALYCLHATAYSGQTFLPLMERLGRRRRVMALDTPGYGASDAPPGEIEFETYAEALAEAIRATRGPGHEAVNILGYHTGAMLAVEIAARDPGLVRSLVLMGIPFFVGDEREEWRRKLVHPTRLTESFDQFRPRWEYFIPDRTRGLPLERAFLCFVDELSAYPREWWAHEALFRYRAESRLPMVQAPVLIINTASPLAKASRAAAALMRRATIVEMPEIEGAPFDMAPDRLAREIERFC